MLSTVQEEGIFAPFRSDEEIFSLAAEGLVNAQKPHQGVTGKNAGLHQGPAVSNSTTAQGVSWRQWSGSVPGATVTYDYDAFGNKINSTGTTPNNYLYRGEQFDSDLGIYYLRARYYNPLTGRFLSVDSEAGQGQRRYEYANADPVDGMDPSGNEAIIEFALLQFYPKRLPFFFPGFPKWCGFEMGGYLPGCDGGSGGGQSGTGAGPGDLLPKIRA